MSSVEVQRRVERLRQVTDVVAEQAEIEQRFGIRLSAQLGDREIVNLQGAPRRRAVSAGVALVAIELQDIGHVLAQKIAVLVTDLEVLAAGQLQDGIVSRAKPQKCVDFEVMQPLLLEGGRGGFGTGFFRRRPGLRASRPLDVRNHRQSLERGGVFLEVARQRVVLRGKQPNRGGLHFLVTDGTPGKGVLRGDGGENHETTKHQHQRVYRPWVPRLDTIRTNN
ncbi:MAG: hypothetical protein HY075_03505 [Deltaproteobacteria bacterium]|nr:hypothetical protein [Deltaproteobacteria bacterium]